jgi:hypothetical protein
VLRPGDDGPARQVDGQRHHGTRAYLQALRSLDPSDRRHESLLQQVDLADIAAACRARLGGGLTEAGSFG